MEIFQNENRPQLKKLGSTVVTEEIIQLTIFDPKAATFQAVA